MRTFIPFLFLTLFTVASSAAQTARVQFIQNSPGPTSVDVYRGSTLFFNNFTFRTASPYMDMPAGDTINIGIAPKTSTSVSDAVATFPVVFDSGKTYIIMIAGVIGATGPTAVNLFIKDNAHETGPANGVDVTVFHGSPDFPAVDVDAVLVANNLVSNLSFGRFTDYITLPPALYDLAVQAAGTNNTGITLRANLSSMAGGTITVFASGYFLASPSLGVFMAFPDGSVVKLQITPIARVQIIHNSPEATFDLFIDSTRVTDNFTFRKATAFFDLPADRVLRFGVADSNSSGTSDITDAFPINFQSGKRYTVVAGGLSGVNSGPHAFNFFLKPDTRETTTVGTTDFIVFHGITDVGAVDIDAVFETDNIVSNLSYGEFTNYTSLPSVKYDFTPSPVGSNASYASFRADLSSMSGQAATIFVSGFLSDIPAMGLFAALPDGTVVAFPATPNARIQIIHDSPAPVVDVYIGNTRLIDNFEFRKATPFINIPADRNLTVNVAPASSASPTDAFASFPLNLAAGGTYLAIAAGDTGATGSSAFNIFLKPNARETGAGGNVALTVFHGVSDAGAVDLDALYDADNLISNLSFGSFSNYLSLSPAKYDLILQPAGTNSNSNSYRADLSGLSGNAAVVFASGFMSQLPGLGLFAALPDGTVVEFTGTPTARVQVIHNSPAPVVDVYVGNTRLLDGFEFRKATPFLSLPADRSLTIRVTADSSTSSASTLAVLPLNFASNETYTAVASGVVGTSGPSAFNLFLKEGAKEFSLIPGNVDAQFFHGSTDAPEVDIRLPGGAVLFDNIQYGEFSGYQAAPAADYKYYLTPFNNNNNILGAYIAEWSQHPGEAVTVFASGYYSGVSPAFALWAAFGSGVTVPLPPVAVPTSEPAEQEGISVWPNPATEMVSVKMYMKESEELTYRIVDAGGKTLQAGSFGQVNAGAFSETLSVSSLIPGIYCLQVSSGTGTLVQKLVIQR